MNIMEIKYFQIIMNIVDITIYLKKNINVKIMKLVLI